MSDALYQRALALTAVVYRVLSVPGAGDEARRQALQKRALELPQQVRRLGARPGAGELVQLRSALADFRQWLEDEQGAERPVPMAEFEKRAGAFSRALSALKPPA